MSELTQELLKKVLHYCPDTGVFTWLKRPRSMFTSKREFNRWNTRYSGKKAGTLREDGYICINILIGAVNRTMLLAHRLAWFYVKGTWPNVIDHINGKKDDNRISNIRDTTVLGNTKNVKIYKTNTTGIMGVVWQKDKNKWHAGISVNKKRKHLGYFDNLFDAACARKSAELTYGYHPNHGRR